MRLLSLAFGCRLIVDMDSGPIRDLEQVNPVRFFAYKRTFNTRLPTFFFSAKTLCVLAHLLKSRSFHIQEDFDSTYRISVLGTRFIVCFAHGSRA